MPEPKKTDFQKKLIRWYQTHHRPLPWRETHDPYRIWISEIMLQQTTVPAVVAYYQKWINLFPDIKALSKASLQKVLKAWQGLGYYQRAKNLHKTSKVIVRDFGSQIPKDYNTLRGLPGIGPYTASALLSFAFDAPYPVLDANVRRVLMRLMRIRSQANTKNDKALLQFLAPHIPRKNSSLFNQALMEIGALVCRPKNPLCLLCAITDFCRAFEKGEQEIIPLPKKINFKKIETVIALIKKEGRYLIQKRPSKGLLADLWEFPGGKRKGNESLIQVLHREIREELGIDINKEKYLTKVHHSYTQFQVTLHAYECRLKNNPQLKGKVHRWVSLRGMRRYPFPSGSVKIIRFLEEKEKAESMKRMP